MDGVEAKVEEVVTELELPSPKRLAKEKIEDSKAWRCLRETMLLSFCSKDGR